MRAMDILGFWFFSMVEGLAIYAMTFYLFRFGYKKYFWHSFVMILLMTLQSFLFREELSLAYLSPVVFLISTIFFLSTVIRVPFIWSMFMAVTGYVAYGVIQNLIIFLSFGFLSIDQVQQVKVKGYMLQFLSGMLLFGIGKYIYRKGLGFSFEFEKLRFRSERVALVFVNAILILSLGAMMFYKEVYMNLIVFLVSLLVFLYYSIRKETKEND